VIKIFSINDVWRETVKIKYDRDAYTEEFTRKVLQPSNITKKDIILDVSAGTGLLSLDLIARGYNVECSDGDTDMIEKFREEAEIMGLETEARLISWAELLEEYDNRPKLIINRGNSLCYAATWRKEGFDAEESYYRIMEALRNFHTLLQTDGYLFQDCIKKGNEKRVSVFGTMTLDGKTYELEWERKSFQNEKRGEWITTLRNRDEEIRIVNHSYNITSENLTEMLETTEFKTIEPIKLDSEPLYQSFLARK